jgi:hypothetical protein
MEMGDSGWQLTEHGHLFSDLLDHNAQATLRKIR